MRKLLIIFTLLVVGVLGMSGQKTGQKVVTTKPSVMEMISVAKSSKPYSTIIEIARKNGFKHTLKSDFEGIGFKKYIGPNKYVYLVYSDDGEVDVTSYTKSVVTAWETQIKRLGYHFSTHDSYEWTEFWDYTKPGSPTIRITYNQATGEYGLAVKQF